MLTADDGRSDGAKTGYLDKPAAWRSYDPELFDILQDAVRAGHRNTDAAKTGGMLPGAVFHSDLLEDSVEERLRYFDLLAVLTPGCDMVFFDPDNGMEVKSKPKGRKASCKYVYFDEVRRFHGTGKSVIVFQHFARVKRDMFVARLRGRFMSGCSINWVGVLRTSNVAYFLVPAPRHTDAIRAACSAIEASWGPHIRAV